MAQPGEPKETSQNRSGNLNSNNNSENLTTETRLSSTGTTGTQTQEHDDRDFDPTAEALIDEIDDERTLEEEEALAGNNEAAVQNELDTLRKESEMPIEELLAYYQRMREEENGRDDEFGDEDEDSGDDDDEEEIGENPGGEIMKEKDQTVQGSEQIHLQDTTKHQQFNLESQQPVNHEHTPAESIQYSETISLNPPSISIERHQTLQPTLSGPGINAQSDTSTLPTNLERQYDKQRLQAMKCNPHPRDRRIELSQQSECSNHRDIISSSAPRPRHTMTEFLLGSETNADGVFKTLLDYDLDDSDDLDEDYSYTDDENSDERDWRRTIHVGPDHQAEVPEGLSTYEGDLLPYQTEDKLLWRCHPDVSQEDILFYLKQAAIIPKRNDISLCPSSVPKVSDETLRIYHERLYTAMSNPELNLIEQNDENVLIATPPENMHDVYMSQSRKRARIDFELGQENAIDGLDQACDDVDGDRQAHPSLNEENSTMTSSLGPRNESSPEEYFQDEEQLLFLLTQCSYNFDEALRRRSLDPFKYYIHDPMTLWSQDECLGFEHGLRTYGKDFRLIRDNKVPTRSRAEVVAFYYLWKKSERHDIYTNQYKLDRKRCLSHPGTTDYMDKFMEDNESVLDTSDTPTPTDSTADVNQQQDASHGCQSVMPTSYQTDIGQSPQQLICIPPDEIQCTGLKGDPSAEDQYNILPHRDHSAQQDGSICLDGDTIV